MQTRIYLQKLALVGLVASGLGALGCSKKGPECDALIESMNTLGGKVDAAQKAADKPDAKPEELVAALRPLATDAASAAKKLTSLTVTVPELKTLTGDFQTFAKSLGDEATKIAEAANQLAGADALGRALEEAQKQVETSQGELEKLCTATPTVCTPVSELLGKLPSPPTPPDDPKAVEAWAKSLETWLGSLRAAVVNDPAVKSQLDAFATGWEAVSKNMLSLAKLSDTAKSVEAAGKQFDALIDKANKTIDGANQFCGRKDR